MATASIRERDFLWWRQVIVDYDVAAIKQNILGRLQQIGITQEQLGARMGVSQERISNIINHDEPLQSDLISRCAQCLGTTLQEIVVPGRFPPKDE